MSYDQNPSPFGYDSYTYLTCDDFEAVLRMDELTGAIIVSYMITCKGNSQNIDDASKGLADWLSSRKGNDIIFLPYNPGIHWVLGVLDMKSDTCYYLDSLSSGNFNMQLKQIVDS
uniref:Ubiquitin-like protease family profile domain-containing protein n=1 Tax=Lactuca sativa TaxID=4236 RepID=A0A9R1VAI3_LACSA|nr:hypothetical protein LSAT_V11C600312310 [Lactuca sativa]